MKSEASVKVKTLDSRMAPFWGQETISMGPGDVPKYPKEVSTKKMTLKNLNLKKLHQISENPPRASQEA